MQLKNKVPQKIDFRSDITHESHPTAWGCAVVNRRGLSPVAKFFLVQYRLTMSNGVVGANLCRAGSRL